MARKHSWVAGLVPFLLSLTLITPSSAFVVKRDVSPADNSELQPGWTYVGCYTDKQNSRTLSASTYSDNQNMDGSACVQYCSKKGYVYAGTEYSDECYCGNALADATTLQKNSSCSMGCAANSSEACGGPNLLNIYYSNQPAPQGPQTNPGPAGWTSFGCWTDGGTRTLSNQVQPDGGAAGMSVAGCTTACGSAGYTLAGLEYASECWCDNSVSSSASKTNITDCNMVCNGNSSEFCGAGNRLDMYASGGTSPSIKAKNIAAAPPSGWQPLGCYNDSVGSRTLSQAQYGLGAMTVELCTAACAKGGYSYAGVEYGGECYCDSTIRNSGAQVSDGRCSMSCKGNNNEICGGSNGLSMYQLTGWSLVGCWTDAVGGRTLPQAQYGLGSMTNEKCTTACKKAGYTYAGTEYGGECYCGNSAQNGGGPAPDGNSGCNMPCSGNSDEVCGGSNRLSVWSYNSTGVSTTTTGSSSATSTKPGAPTSSKVTPTGSPTPSGSVNSTAILPFKYQGCYSDSSPNGRTLQYQQPDNKTLTVESCISMCSSQGYTIAGMEYSDQCFCDNYIRNSPTQLSESKCSMPCAGNSGEMCGAGNVLSVYSNGTMTPYQAATIQKTGLPGSWKYQGCLTDIDGARSLPYEIVWQTNNSNTGCLTQCAEYGYGAAGTEYSQQCYCGDVQNVIDAGATIQPDSDCNMVCSEDEGKNGGYICGGPSRLSYYTWEGTPLNSWDFAEGDDAGKYEFLISGPIIPLVTSPARNGKVTYMEKFGTEPANNSTGAYEFDITLVGNYTAAWREMHVKTDIFCSASLTLPDVAGRQINVGGWANGATFGIRLYTPDGSPGVAGTNDWEENGEELQLLNGRWYPTAMTMANGSILVMGGEEGSNGAPVPTLEVLPSPSGEVLYCDYLERTDPNNLYPFLAVLPSGDIFVAYYNEARILDAVTLETKRTLPNMPGAVNDFSGGRTYPFEGTAMILPQYADNYDSMTVIICGGSVPFREIGLDNCVSINPDQPSANWTLERMPSKRVISCMAALPDGTYLIANGAMQGRAGFGLASEPNYNSVLYDPRKPENARMTVMANTTIARLYHSELSLLDDGRVLVSGSDPEDARAFAPQEYRNELWIPPYILGGAPRPSFKLTNIDWNYGESVTFSITPSGSGPVSGYKVSMIGATSSTHGNSMGQRTFFPATSCSGTSCTVTAPPNANVCPPSWFQVFLLDGNDIPSNAQWVRIGGDPGKLGNWPNYPDFTTPGLGTATPLF